ncbi:MAG: PilZ domain-containing protein [Lachnospiraceae bacterium]
MEFTGIGEGPQITLCIHSDKTKTNFRLDAKILKYLDKSTAIVQLFHKEDQPLSFEKVRVNLEYKPEHSAPFLWNHIKIVPYKGSYIVRVGPTKGVKTNRRSSFRVSIGVFARTNNEGLPSATVRDVSHSGFALSTNKKEVKLKVGEALSASFSDQGFNIHLDGRLVRIEERDGVIIYGFCFIAPCPNLDQYIALKQRPLRKSNSQ